MERKGAAYSVKATRPAHDHSEHLQQTQVTGMFQEGPLPVPTRHDPGLAAHAKTQAVAADAARRRPEERERQL